MKEFIIYQSHVGTTAFTDSYVRELENKIDAMKNFAYQFSSRCELKEP